MIKFNFPFKQVNVLFKNLKQEMYLLFVYTIVVQYAYIVNNFS